MDANQQPEAVKVVMGAGPVGWTVATQLAGQGHRVRVLTRSGSGPDLPLVERRRVDVADATAVAAAVEGADAVFHCIHGSSYSHAAWERELPGAEQAVLAAAGRAGAVVVFPESLYSYSHPENVMAEGSERSASGGKRGVRTALLAARAASATPTVSVAASDFFGPRVLMSHAGERLLRPLLAGRSVSVMGRKDVPHSFTYIPDLAAAMVRAAERPQLWNSVLHAPTGPAPTQADMVAAMAEAAGLPVPRITAVPGVVVRAAAVVMPGMRELAETLYQFERPFVMDSAASCRLLDLEPTPLAAAARATTDWWRGHGTPAGR